jgi:hypothetical protein
VHDSDREASPDLLNMLPEGQFWIQTDGRCTICKYWYSYLENPMLQQAEDLLDPKDMYFWRNPWLGNPFGNPQNSAINPIPNLLNSGIFIGILFFQS